jgi:uncharacterized repeat protein (TIGR03803 family)
VLHNFQNTPDGADPGGDLVFDAGNLYGATSGDTIRDYGTVFKLSPTRNGTWTVTVLHNFHGSDGVGPSGIVFDGMGNLLGATAGGGRSFYGTAYRLSPPKRQGGKWTETDLYDFSGGGNGGTPWAGVIRDSKGNLYGTGAKGGNNFGIVFELTPFGSKWKEKMIYNFCSRNYCADGASPLAGLVMDDRGVLYGTTTAGGAGCSPPGCGVVFKLARTRSGWRETVLHRFRGGSADGAGPQERLMFDRMGNLYGTADVQQGYQGGGVVFEITP